MKEGILFLLLIILMNNALAQCSDGQINLNTASVTDLDKITYVGPATAIKIVNARPFDSLDNLLNVSGIGEAKLKAIKEENLACVESSVDEKKETELEEVLKKSLPSTNQNEEISLEKINPSTNLIEEEKSLKVIKLNAKDIKNNNPIQENKEENSIKKYAGAGLIFLCILLVILLSLKRKHGFEE